MQGLRSLAVYAALALALLLWVDDADARPEGWPSPNGSAARASTSPPAAWSAPMVIVSADHVTATPAQNSGSLGGLFSRPGLLGGFAAGFLGSGLLGLVFGHGLFGGLGGVASILGLVLQLALIVLLCRLIWTWWNGRNAPAFAGLSPRQLADPYLRSRHEFLPDLETAPSVDDPADERKG
jgi:predicted lipid-binding transport protein (Tim44 family)